MPLSANERGSVDPTLFEYRIGQLLGQGAFGAVYLVMEYLAGGSLRTINWNPDESQPAPASQPAHPVVLL